MPVTTLPIYPMDLPGLSWNMIRRPKAGSTSIQTHASGRETRVGYWAAPLYEWEFTYELLRDFPAGAIRSELRRLQGFFLDRKGALLPFFLRDPDDCCMAAQPLGTGDGTTSAFLVTRTYGDLGSAGTVTQPVGSGGTVTQPVGSFIHDPPTGFRVYLNGLLQSPASYTITGSLGNYSVQFAAPPLGGIAITVDIDEFLFTVRFKDDSLDFERFSGADGAGFWMINKVVLEGLRAS